MPDKDYHIKNNDKPIEINEKQAYEAAEKVRLKASIRRTDTEKFYIFMRLMKINNMLKKATITHIKMKE